MTATTAKDHALDLIAQRPAFVIASENESAIILEGPYELFAEHDGVCLAEDFILRIEVPRDYPLSIPRVLETSGVIPEDYEHRYADGSLCLGVNGEIAACLARDSSIAGFLDSYVQEALFSAKYFDRFGCYPFGERAHGGSGILAYYSEEFDVGAEGAFHILRAIAKEEYRGHLPCPCGSGATTRRCHGPAILEAIRTPARQLAAINDYLRIVDETLSRHEIRKRRAQFSAEIAKRLNPSLTRSQADSC